MPRGALDGESQTTSNLAQIRALPAMREEIHTKTH
jgi:hypothetical protein